MNMGVAEMPRGTPARGSRRKAEKREQRRRFDTETFQIADPEAVAALLCKVLSRRYLFNPHDKKGNKTETLDRVADALKVSRSTIRRLVLGETEVVAWAVADALQRWLEPGEVRSLEKALFDEDTRRRRRQYVRYLKKQRHRLRTGHSGKNDFFFPSKLDEPQLAGPRQRFLDFDRHMDAWRIDIANLRVYEPIVGWRDLWNQMEDEEKKQFVKLGYKREELLRGVEKRLGARAVP